MIETRNTNNRHPAKRKSRRVQREACNEPVLLQKLWKVFLECVRTAYILLKFLLLLLLARARAHVLQKESVSGYGGRCWMRSTASTHLGIEKARQKEVHACVDMLLQALCDCTSLQNSEE